MSRVDLGQGCSYDPEEIAFTYSTTGGPGGQHANRTQSRVSLSFPVERLTAEPHQLERVRAIHGDEIRLVVDKTRSQMRNREIAVQRLEGMLRVAMKPPKKRHKTKPSAGAKRRRLEAKARRSQTKKDRKLPDY